MGLSVEQLLQQVKHFLATDQPTMAVLYMRKALALLEAERQAATESGMDVYERLFFSIAHMVCEATEPIRDCINRVAALFSVEASQSDFALAAEA